MNVAKVVFRYKQQQVLGKALILLFSMLFLYLSYKYQNKNKKKKVMVKFGCLPARLFVKKT